MDDSFFCKASIRKTKSGTWLHLKQTKIPLVIDLETFVLIHSNYYKRGQVAFIFFKLSNLITRSDLNLSAPLISFFGGMSTFLIRILLPFLFIAMTIPQQSGKTITAMFFICSLWCYANVCECVCINRGRVGTMVHSRWTNTRRWVTGSSRLGLRERRSRLQQNAAGKPTLLLA